MRFLNRHYGGSLNFGNIPSTCYAKTASSATLAPHTGSFTFAWWGKYNPNCPTATHVIAQFNDAAYSSGWLINFLANNRLDFYVKNASATISSTSAIPDASWHRYVFVANSISHTLSVYRDGVLISGPTANTWTDIGTAELTLGASSQFGNAGGGNMADVCYDVGTAWTAQQISDDYFLGKIPSTVTHRWLLNDGASTTATASIGGLNMTLAGGAVFSADSPMILRNSIRNFHQNSNGLSDSTWSKFNFTDTSLAADPFGGNNATLFTESSDGGATQHHTDQTTSQLNVGDVLIASAYFKASSRNFALIAPEAAAVQVSYDLSTLATVVINNSPIGTYKFHGCESVGNGWVRCWVGYTKLSQSYEVRYYAANVNNSVSYVGNGSAAIYMYGAMVEKTIPSQTTPSQYISTLSIPLSIYGKRDYRQNWFRYSDNSDFSNSVWVKSGCSMSGSSLIEDGTTAVHRVYQSVPIFTYANVPFTASIEVIQGTRRYFTMEYNDVEATFVIFDLQLGIVTYSGASVLRSKITPLSTGGWMCSASWSINGIGAAISFNASNSATHGIGTLDTYTGINGNVAIKINKPILCNGYSTSEFIKTNNSAANSSGAPRNTA